MSQIEDFVYDDQEAVKFIQNNLPQELKGKYSDDDITYVTDVIYDYFESQGMLDPTPQNKWSKMTCIRDSNLLQMPCVHCRNSGEASFCYYTSKCMETVPFTVTVVCKLLNNSSQIT